MRPLFELFDNESVNFEDFYKKLGYSSAKSVKPRKLKLIQDRIIKLGLDINSIKRGKTTKSIKELHKCTYSNKNGKSKDVYKCAKCGEVIGVVKGFKKGYFVILAIQTILIGVK